MTEAPFETASWLRRVLALVVDWTVSTFIVIAIFGLDEYTEPGGPDQFAVLGVYVVESALLTWLAAGSFGKLVTGLRVVPVGVLRPLNPLKVLARQVLIALVIPPLVFRSDGRGLHDLFAGTATVTMPTFRQVVGGQAHRSG